MDKSGCALVVVLSIMLLSTAVFAIFIFAVDMNAMTKFLVSVGYMIMIFGGMVILSGVGE